MPTGYTADVQDGTVTDFADFAMNCARAFGALIDMRDSPSGTPIPEQFEPSDYHKKALDKAMTRTIEVRRMTLEQAKSARDLEEAKRLADRANRADRIAEHRDRYEAMLLKAQNWVPPTAEHEEMKKFMIQQLKQSIEFDCANYKFDEAPLPDAEQWLKDQISDADRDVDYHSQEYAAEVQRVKSRNKWLADLRQSLKAKEPTS